MAQHYTHKEEKVILTPEEKFTFDLEGYLVVKGVLAQNEIDEINTLAAAAWPGEYDEKGVRRTSRISQWGAATQRLMDHPGIVPYLTELLGPYVRVDHDYSIFMQKGGSAGRLHGGPVMHGGVTAGDHWYKYHDGIMRNGLTVFTYCLSHAGPGDGGFGCVPGSHKSNLSNHIPAEVRWSMARCRGQPSTNGALYYLNTVRDIRRGQIIITMQTTIPTQPSSSIV
jgi:hypothetical protein